MTDIIKYNKQGISDYLWANDIVLSEEVNFNGWQCGIGLESIDIKSNGEIYRGTCHVGGKIGHVDNDNWNLPTTFVTCTKTKCTCVADLKSTRYKDEKIRKKLKDNVKFEIIKRGGSEDSNNF